MARPAFRSENPCLVKWMAKNGITNVPNLFRNIPAKRTQTGRGNWRSVATVAANDGRVFIQADPKQKTLLVSQQAGSKQTLLLSQIISSCRSRFVWFMTRRQ